MTTIEELRQALAAETEARQRAEGAVTKTFDSFVALLSDEPVLNGEYAHLVTCNASRQQPVGNDMCSCPIGRRIKAETLRRQEAERKRSDAMLELGKEQTLRAIAERSAEGLRTEVRKALGFYQTTHIHAILEAALAKGAGRS